MRLSWWNGSRLLGRAARQSRRRLGSPLRVRQLERRRVLDAAVQSLVITAVTTTDSTTTTSTSDTQTTQPPVTFDWTPPQGANASSSESADLAQGVGLNADPVLVVPLEQHVNEGKPLDLSGINFAPPIGLFIDTDLADTHTATIDWGDGSPLENASVIQGLGAGALGGMHTYADQGTYTVTVAVMDNNGGSDSDTFDVIVGPVAPTATFANNGPVNEGSPATVSFSNQFDPSSADTLAGFHYAYDLNNDGTFDVGNGTYAGSVTSTSQNVSTSILGDGPSDHIVKARIIDKDGQFTDYTTSIHVQNVAPTLTNITGDTVNENDVATISMTIVDPSVTDFFQVEANWQDGASTTIAGLGSVNVAGTIGSTTYQWTAATRQLTLTHKYLDDGPTTAPSDTYSVSLIVRDDDLDSSGPYTAPVIVNDVPPVLTVAASQNVFEGDLLDLSGVNNGAPSIGSFTDAGTFDTHTATINWGDGSPTQNATVVQGVGSGTLGGTHLYADDGVYQVTVTVTDKDGKSDTDILSVMVTNKPPSLSKPADVVIFENDTATLKTTIIDAGLQDVFSVEVNWQDGTNDIVVGLAQVDSTGTAGGTTYVWTASTRELSVSHQYLDDGASPGNGTDHDEYHVTLTVHDNFPSTGPVQSATVTVENLAPAVTLNSVPDIDENGVVTLTGRFADVGHLDGHKLTVIWGDPNNAAPATFTLPALQNTTGIATLFVGDVYNSATDNAVLTITTLNTTNGQVGFSVQHQYLDDGLALGNGTTDDLSTIGVTVTDDDAQSGSNSTTVTVHNVQPVVILSAVTDINENGAATLNGSYADTGLLDAHIVVVTWGDPNNSLSSTFAVSPIQDATGIATLNVGDTFNSSTDGAILAIMSIDPVTGEIGFSVQHQYLDDGLALGNGTISDSSTIHVSVNDDDMQSGSGTATVTVRNLTPTVTLDAVPTIDENGEAALTGSYTDIGLLDAHVLMIQWDDANSGDASTFAVNAIRNAAGLATLSIGQTFDSSTDAGVLTITSIDAVTGQVGFSVLHRYLDDGTAPGNGTTSDVSTITVSVMDDDSQTGSNTTTVTVNNVAPSILNIMGASINEANVAKISFSVGDPGTLDVFTVNIDWRDAPFSQSATINDLGANDASGTVGTTLYTWTAVTRQLTLSHLYADDAEYQVEVRVADDDMKHIFTNTPNSNNYTLATTLVAVANVPPTLAGTTGLMVDEGSPVTLANLGVKINDHGFDNPANQTQPLIGNLTTEDFAVFSITWGDGSPGQETMPVHVVNRASGALDSLNPLNSSLTTAEFMHDPHYYADDGIYTVTIRMSDDNMGAFSNPALFTTGVAGVDYVDRQFQITVRNVTPTLVVNRVEFQEQRNAQSQTTMPITPSTTVQIMESGTVSLAASFTDPGFSLDPNPGKVIEASFPRNEIFRYYISWGDNQETIGESTAANVFSVVNGESGILTNGSFDTAGMIHTYADDGTYTITVRLADDNMGAFAAVSKFATGQRVDFGTNSGGDYVETTLTVDVKNVSPTFVSQPNGDKFAGTDVNIQGNTVIQGAYFDPGFDNSDNQNLPRPGETYITDIKHESFTQVIDWGDGTVDAIHDYAAVHINNEPVQIKITGPKINNNDPNNPLVIVVTDFGSTNLAVLRLVKQQNVTVPAIQGQNYTFRLDWGNGTVQEFMLSLRDPVFPSTSAETQGHPLNLPNTPKLPTTTVVAPSLRVSGNAQTNTSGTFNVMHNYVGAPDPLHASAPIPITVTIVDDNNGTANGSISIKNPGIQEIFVAIDTTPDVPRLEYVPAPTAIVFIDRGSTSLQSVQNTNTRVASSEMVASSDRYLELVVISPEGKVVEQHRLPDEALADLRSLVSSLPDGHYQIYLVRTDNNSRRLVIDVYVRHGRVIEPSDSSEGTRDRPPEGAQHIQAQPLENNPKLERVPNERPAGAQNVPAVLTNPVVMENTVEPQQATDVHDEPVAVPSATRLRWAVPLAGLGCVAAEKGSWRRDLAAAFDQADERAWKRLRRAGRVRLPK